VTIRIGILGAARIAPVALIRPAASVPGVEVSAVAARDAARASAFARSHGIPRVHPSYQQLVEDPALDAVYIPLPNSLHCEWTERALAAGKHVLCEKPSASNAVEAARMAEATRRAGRTFMEAFHWRYHPLADRLVELARGGTIGRIRHVEAALCVPFPIPGDIRYREDLAGGATMDLGAYCLHIVRHVVGEEPEVTAARAKLSSPRVDRAMTADLAFPGGATGRIDCSLLSRSLLRVSARVVGERGELSVFNPIRPQVWHRLRVTTPEKSWSERVAGDSTYVHQLRAFVAAVEGGPSPTGAEDAVANMRVIDAVYARAGLPARGNLQRPRT
jgi:predicted dehydrogenase